MLSRVFKILHVLNAFLIISAGISVHECFIQGKTKFLHSAFFFPTGVNSEGPVITQQRYCRLMLSLNGLLRHLSNGCEAGVRPPRITATLILHRHKSDCTDTVKWAPKESHKCRNCLLSGFLGKQVSIHSFTPEITNRIPELKMHQKFGKSVIWAYSNKLSNNETNTTDSNLPFSSIQFFLRNDTLTEK